MASKAKRSSTSEETPARIKAAGAMAADPAKRATLGTPSHLHSTSSASLASMAASRASTPTKRGGGSRSSIRNAPLSNAFGAGVYHPEK